MPFPDGRQPLGTPSDTDDALPGRAWPLGFPGYAESHALPWSHRRRVSRVLGWILRAPGVSKGHMQAPGYHRTTPTPTKPGTQALPLP